MKRKDSSAALLLLKKKRARLENDLVKVNKAIAALDTSGIHFMDWKQKALACMDAMDGCVQTSQILEWVFIDDAGKLKNTVLRRKYITALSVSLNSLHSEGLVKKFRLPGTQGHFYGLANWFTEDGSLAKKYFGKRLHLMFPDKTELTVKAF